MFLFSLLLLALLLSLAFALLCNAQFDERNYRDNTDGATVGGTDGHDLGARLRGPPLRWRVAVRAVRAPRACVASPLRAARPPRPPPPLLRLVSIRATALETTACAAPKSASTGSTRHAEHTNRSNARKRSVTGNKRASARASARCRAISFVTRSGIRSPPINS